MKCTPVSCSKALVVSICCALGWLSAQPVALSQERLGQERLGQERLGQERLGRGPEPVGRVRESSSTLPPPVNLARPTPDPGFAARSPSDSAQSWNYLAEQKRQEDPKAAIRRKAELKAAQRQARLAAQQWYGVSNARPTVSATPTMSVYSTARVTPGPAPNQWRISDRVVIHDLP
jgi:hypothetical protein